MLSCSDKARILAASPWWAAYLATQRGYQPGAWRDPEVRAKAIAWRRTHGVKAGRASTMPGVVATPDWVKQVYSVARSVDRIGGLPEAVRAEFGETLHTRGQRITPLLEDIPRLRAYAAFRRANAGLRLAKWPKRERKTYQLLALHRHYGELPATALAALGGTHLPHAVLLPWSKRLVDMRKSLVRC